jgi:hypothetical protein
LLAKAEQIVTDRRTLKELVEFMEEAVREGLTKREIESQIDLLLDKDAEKRLRQSLKDLRAGRFRSFREPKELLDDLHRST